MAYLCDLALPDLECMRYYPSQRAAGALALARIVRGRKQGQNQKKEPRIICSNRIVFKSFLLFCQVSSPSEKMTTWIQ